MKSDEAQMKPIITPSQVREARALLGWSRDRLAALAELPAEHLRKFERETRAIEPSTLTAIRGALEGAGVEFIQENGGELGVRLRKAGSA